MPVKKTKSKKKKNFVRNFLFALGGSLIALLVINLFVDHPTWQEPQMFKATNNMLVNPSGAEDMGEQKQIMEAAQKNVLNNQINGIQVKFVFGKQMGEYALVRAVPLHNETDPLQIVLQKVDGSWEVIESGTAFPDLEGKVPSGLFE